LPSELEDVEDYFFFFLSVLPFDEETSISLMLRLAVLGRHSGERTMVRGESSQYTPLPRSRLKYLLITSFPQHCHRIQQTKPKENLFSPLGR
jgi:hypothetical protein